MTGSCMIGKIGYFAAYKYTMQFFILFEFERNISVYLRHSENTAHLQFPFRAANTAVPAALSHENAGSAK